MQTLSQWLSDSSRSCAPLTDTLARQHARDQVLFVTFTNFEQVVFAVNWARQLKVVGLRGLVGTPVELPPAHMHNIRAAGSSLFCANSELIRRNPQAGRWAEVAPLLRFGLHVIISDSDVSWLRNPTAYFHEVRRKHPAVDFLLCTDRAYNGYNGAPLLAAPHHSADLDPHDLDLEADGEFMAVPSYNIGIMVLYAHAAANLSAMIDVLWIDAVSRTVIERGRKEPMRGGLSAWDQGPINKFVLHGRALPHDRALVLIDRALPSDGELSSSIGELSNTQKQLYEQLTARGTLSTTPSTRRGRGTRVRVRTGMLMTSDDL
jgi:hypothetical protein